MPDSLDEDAVKTVRRLLHDGMDPSNMTGYDPTLEPDDSDDALPIHFGTYVSNLPDPQVTVMQTQGEFTVGGERWSGSNSDGGMNQFRRGMVIVQVWATAGQQYNGNDVQDALSLVRHEVERVLGEYDMGPDSGPNSGVIWSFSTEWNGRFPDEMEDRTDPTWQSQVTVTYDWERQT